MYDSSLIFERVKFSSGGCFGSCPIDTLCLDSSGHIIFFGKEFTQPYSGLYEGYVGREALQKFVSILRSSDIKNLPENTGLRIDSPFYIMELTFNGHTRKIEGSNFSYFHRTLLNFLATAYKRSSLKKRLVPYNFQMTR